MGVIFRFDTLQGLNWNSLGDVAAGFAAPLAFLWLVVGYYLQRQELRLQRRELRLQREALRLQRDEAVRQTGEMQRQAEAIRENEQHARRDTFLKQVEFFEYEMSLCAAHLAANSIAATGMVGRHQVTQFAPLHATMQAFVGGDRTSVLRYSIEVFSDQTRIQNLSGKLLTHVDLKASFGNYLRAFEHLQTESKSLIGTPFEKVLATSEMARLYRLFIEKFPGFGEISD